jgi:hypothetical protein
LDPFGSHKELGGASYFINGYCWLNYHYLLGIIDGYFINGYCWLNYHYLLVVILLVEIDGYFIGGY